MCDDDEQRYTFDEIVSLEAVRGGVRLGRRGFQAYITFGNGDDQERVTMWSRDRDRLALALRRAADDIDGVGKSQRNAPPFLQTLDEDAVEMAMAALRLKEAP